MTVIDGEKVWALHATYGFPLEMSLPALADAGYVPSWDRLLTAAKRDGVNMARLLTRLGEAVRDAYPPPVAQHIASRLPEFA